MNYNSCSGLRRLRGLWHISKPKEKKTDHVFYNNRQCKLYNTLIYEALYMTKVCRYQYIYYTVIKHNINDISSGYRFAEQKVLTAVPVCFHNTHPDT